MPRLERLKCVVCQGNIDSPRKQLAGNGLWKLFLSARSLKRINSDDAGCIDCRMKYLNWLKKMMEILITMMNILRVVFMVLDL